MQLYSLIEYSENYSKTWGSLWQYDRDEPALNNAIQNLPGASFKSKAKITGKKPAAGNTKDVKIAVS